MYNRNLQEAISEANGANAFATTVLPPVTERPVR
jgi:hypothetical protein